MYSFYMYTILTQVLTACVTNSSQAPTALQSGRRQCPALDGSKPFRPTFALCCPHPQLVRAELLAEAEVWPHLPPLLLHVRIRANQHPRRPQVQKQRQGDGARAADALLAVGEHAAPARIGRVCVLPLDPLRALALLEGRGDVDLWQIDASVMVKVLWKEVWMLGAIDARHNAEPFQKREIRRRLARAKPQIWKDLRDRPASRPSNRASWAAAATDRQLAVVAVAGDLCCCCCCGSVRRGRLAVAVAVGVRPALPFSSDRPPSPFYTRKTEAFTTNQV